eukprot:TRINITY_DN31557_c0_g1_i1.p1 TRINITY_DN31557_c0_g1~~TRINITY_DN31557_c0_g1_i1.p1  ORF type:complete len:516 (+),score=193.07 TRINITY_DN31557_c0_g1_i1:55-1602(+)
MAPMKRPAAAAAAGSAKRQATGAAVSKRCEPIAEALGHAEELPAGTRQMLRDALPSTLGVPADQRQQFQTQVITWIEQALAGVRKAAEEDKAAADSALQGVEGEKATRDERLAAALATQAEKLQVAADKKQTEKDVAAALKSAKSALADAEKAQKTAEEVAAAHEAKKNNLTSLLETFAVTKDSADLAPATRQQNVKAIVKLGGDFKLDPSMLKSLPGTLNKSLEERGVFDKLVLDQFTEEHQKCIASVEGAIAEGARAKEASAAAVDAAKSAVEAAAAADAKAKEDLKEAMDAASEADNAVKEAQKSVKDFASDLKNAQHDAQAKAKSLEHLQKGALANLAELKEFDGTLPASSQYRHIRGVRFERELLEISEKEAPITRATAEHLFTAAMDGPGVTPTEKRTLKFILKRRDVDSEAGQYLRTKMFDSWYQVLEGVTYERLLLTLAEDATKPIAKEAAEGLWKSAMDANQVTPTEKKTLEYILSSKEFAEDAKAFLEAKLAAAETPALLEEIEG